MENVVFSRENDVGSESSDSGLLLKLAIIRRFIHASELTDSVPINAVRVWEYGYQNST